MKFSERKFKLLKKKTTRSDNNFESQNKKQRN